MARSPRPAAITFAEATCSAPLERSRRMREIVVRHAPAGATRILDLGCGTGGLAFELADALEGVSITGVDVSAANVRAARARAASRRDGDLAFHEADYLTYHAPPFDAIVSDGVFHLIPGSTEALLRKVAADLRSGGVLICGMPYDGFYNRIFAVGRRILRAARSPMTDAAILAIGRMIHGREMDDAGLRERIPYMYIPPVRLESHDFTNRLAPAAGLHLIASYPTPSTSLSQLRHRVTVFEKRTAR
jgi:SAM-dependent methyltransferase